MSEYPIPPELMEKLSEIEHDRWSGQARAALFDMTDDRRRSWERQMRMSYWQLSEPEKEQDREQVRKSLAPLIERIAHLEAQNKALLAFTEQRLEEIRQIEEEITAVEQVIDDMCDCPGADLRGTIAHLAMKRVLERLQHKLAELKRGMR